MIVERQLMTRERDERACSQDKEREEHSRLTSDDEE
jgi:hypothetical protein